MTQPLGVMGLWARQLIHWDSGFWIWFGYIQFFSLLYEITVMDK